MCNGAGLLLITRKDGKLIGFYIILGDFTVILFMSAAREMKVVCALRDVSLKQAHECANQWRSVLREGRNFIEEYEKKHAAMRNLHYLKDIALNTFESRKAELKNDAKACN